MLTAGFYLGASVSGVLCQTSVTPKTKPFAPQQVSSSQQVPENHFPPELLEYFKGDWSGAGKFAKSGKDVASDFSFVADMENQCLVVRQKERAQHFSIYRSLEL